MRKLMPFLFLAVLAGCSGGGISGSDRKTIETILKSVDKDTADSMTFSAWDSTTEKEGDKTWKIVRVKKTYRSGGKGDPKTEDILIRYSGEPLMPLNGIPNKWGDDWKKELKSITWPKNEI